MAKGRSKSKKFGEARPGDRRSAVAGFQRASGQHLGAAEFLAQTAQYGWVAVYLAGYSVEYALKALLLAITPGGRWGETYVDITHGKSGHNLEGLKGRLERTGKVLPVTEAKSFRNIVSWSTTLRYQVRWIGSAEVETFLDSAAIVVKWAGRSHQWVA